jgi:hypothetical protein
MNNVNSYREDAMIGWRARLGFLVPPGNPTVETEMIAMAPKGVSLHFHRMLARGTPGSLEGQTERNRAMIESIDGAVEVLAMVQARRHRRGAHGDQLPPRPPRRGRPACPV